MALFPKMIEEKKKKTEKRKPLTPHIFFFRFCEMCHGLYSKVYYH